MLKTAAAHVLLIYDHVLILHEYKTLPTHVQSIFLINTSLQG